MSDNPLLTLWNDLYDGQVKDEALFIEFVNSQLLDISNVDVTGHTATAFYRGQIGDGFAFHIAQDLAALSGGKLQKSMGSE